MQLQLIDHLKTKKNADLVILPFWEEKKRAKAAFPDKKFERLFGCALQEEDFLGRAQETLLLYPNSSQEKRLLLLGLGAKDSICMESLRKSVSQAVRVCQKKKLKNVHFYVPSDSPLKKEEVCRAYIEGAILTNYTFDLLKRDSLKEKNSALLETISLIGIDKKLEPLCTKTLEILYAVNFVRDLVNANADDMTAKALSSHAKDLAKNYKTVKVTILGKQEMEKEKLGLILAVNRGSVQEPALIILQYQGNPSSKDWTAVVGKGITYDTGGLNLKLGNGMETMKCDMAGAATVLGILKAAAATGLKKNIIGVIAAAENAIGPNSFKPGDVYISHSGKSVEISNTDAEGRLVLADAISYLQKSFSPSRIIDLATLTGGVIIALGEEASGLFCNNESLAKAIEKASEVTAERVWRLPLFAEYKNYLKSSIADIKNCGPRKATSATAAIFLEQFVKKDIPWAHLDIAGTAYVSEPSHYHKTPATGVGVRLVIEFLESL